MPDWDIILQFIEALGWLEGVSTIFLFVFHMWIYALYKGRLNDRQDEIDRLAKDNREYREMFVELLDRKFGFNKKEN